MIFGGPDARIAKSLAADEIEIMSVKPDRIAWAVDQWLHVVAIIVCLCVAVGAGASGVGLAALAYGLGLGVYLWARWLAVSHTRYVLTSHRAMRASGVLRADQEFMTWSKVTDVSIERSLGDRLTGTATIRIHSANEQSSFKTLRDVGRPLEFAHQISELVTKRHAPRPPGGGGGDY